MLGRAAVPVRLIPHLAPCLSAEELALILARQDPRCKWDLSAHWLRQDGTVGEMHPDEWHGVALEIGLLPAQPGVMLQATMSLPEGVFVWRDELESEYPKFIGEDGAYSPSVTNGNEDYEGSGALSFDRRPPTRPDLIYAGFEHALGDAFKTPPAVAPVPAVVAEALPLEHWKMRVQAEAAAEWKRLRALSCNPTRQSIRPYLVKWCKANGVKTDRDINPSDG